MTDMRVEEVVLPVIPASLPSPAPDSPLEALSWLGDTVEEVAEGLRARGIKGKLAEADACPLSVYLDQFGFSLTVDYMDDENNLNCVLLLDGKKLLGHSVLARFANDFDDEKFPYLIIDNG